MKQTLLLIFLFCVSMVNVLAQRVTPEDILTVGGTMGEGTRFTLDLTHYGGVPGVIEGTTSYHRKNGSVSQIPVFGSVTRGAMGKYHFSLIEEVTDKLCGHFDFDIPEDCLSHELGGAVEGRWWLGQKELKFMDVKVNGSPYLGDYVVSESSASAYNGKYGYCYASASDKSQYNYRLLQMYMGPDSTTFIFNQEIEGQSFDCSFSSPKGFGSNPRQLDPACWQFRLGNVQYRVLDTGSSLLVCRADAASRGSNGLPKGVEIEGIYPRQTCMAFSRKERTEGTATLSCEVTLEAPYVEGEESRFINDWISKEFGGLTAENYSQLVDDYAKSEVESLETWEDMEDYQAPWSDFEIVCDVFNRSRNHINLTSRGCRYMGGAHGMPFRLTQSLDRATGHVMTYDDWFSDVHAIEPMVVKAMREQNEEASFYEAISLPDLYPWADEDGMHFMYQFYEATPYSDGTPECVIPLSKLLPYMTAYGKKVAK